MNNHQDETTGELSPFEILKQSLQAVASTSRKQKEVDFAEAYPLIEEHLHRKVPVKDVIESFKGAYGHALHPPRFRKMLDQERKRRAESGDLLGCGTCGRPYDPSVSVDASASDRQEDL